VNDHDPECQLDALLPAAERYGARQAPVRISALAQRLIAPLLVVGLAAAPASTRAAQTSAWPPPDVAKLLRLVTPAIDKPVVPVLALPLPPPPGVPELPMPPLTTDPANRPTAPLGTPRTLACNPLGTVFGVGSELIECGKARFQRGEFGGAREAFQDVVERSGNREVVRAGRYWLAETLLRLGKRDTVEHHLSLVVSEDRRSELGAYAAHLLGWILLERGDAARALGLFEPLVRGGAPPDLVPYVQHGRALSLYGLKRYAEARDQWTALLNRSVPRVLATEAGFWLGDTLGRLGDPGAAVARLQVFAASGPSYLIEPGLLRLGWWSRAAGQPLDAAKTYRGLLNAYPDTREQLWVRFGLVQALVDLGDLDTARAEGARLQALDTKQVVTVPALLAIARGAVETGHPGPGVAALQDVLGRNLEPPTRAYALLLAGDLYRQTGESGEARTRLDAARAGSGPGALRWYAAVRLGQMELEARDFAAARGIADALLREQLSPEYRAAALVIAAESAYRLQQYDRAATLYARLLNDFPTHPSAGEIAFALGWTELRRGRVAEARQAWRRFGGDLSSHSLAPTALLLGAEVAARAGDTNEAGALLDRVIASFPDQEQAKLAQLDRAVLALNAGRASDALRDLRGLESDAAMSAYLGPVRLARGAALSTTGQVSEAEGEFRGAMAAGEDAMGHLGLGGLAFERQQWEEAAREFAAARDAGGGPAVAAAEYGLAATAFARGDRAEFRQLAASLLAAPRDPATAPYLLAGLVQAAGEDKQWREARANADQLVAAYPDHRVTPPALAEAGRAAAAQEQWASARETFQILADRYPIAPAFNEAQLDFAQALLKTSAPQEARRRLEALVDRPPNDPRVPRALFLLAQAQEAAGDRPAALASYARLRRDHPGAPGADAADIGQARLLAADGRWDEAQPLLQQALATAQGEPAAEAAFQLGEGFRTSGQHEDAVDAYMIAAYTAPDSAWGRRALLGAGKSYTALRQAQPAAIVYRKLLAQSGVEPELADQARQGLKELGVN
jgi:TolA-binding protein